MGKIIKIPPALEPIAFQARLKQFQARKKQPTAEQEAEAEAERCAVLEKLVADLGMICRKMAAIGGTQWAAAQIESEARRAHESAVKHPS